MLGERFIFGVIEFSLEAWLNLLRWLQWEEWRFEIKGEWEPQFHVTYYATLLVVLGLRGLGVGGFTNDIRTPDWRLLFEGSPHVSVEVLLLLILIPFEIDNRMSKNQYEA